MCCSIQKTNDQRKKFFFRPENFPSSRLILRFSVFTDIKRSASSSAAWLGRKIHAHPAPQRGWEGRFTRIRLRSVAGKEDSCASGFAAWLGRKIHAHLAPQRGWEGRCTRIQLADAVGKEDSRASSFPTPSGSRKVKWRFDCPGWKSLCSKREFCPGKDVTVLSFYLNPV